MLLSRCEGRRPGRKERNHAHYERRKECNLKEGGKGAMKEK
jgi:hypothetical protein